MARAFGSTEFFSTAWRGLGIALRRAAIPAVILLAAFLLLPGCAGPHTQYTPQVDLWPLWRYWSADDGSASGWEALGPILEGNRDAKSTSFYFRPFYNKRNDIESNVIESDCIWPFGFGTERPDMDRTVVFPLYDRTHDTYSDGTEQTRTIFLPFYYHRTGRDKPTDLVIFPFGGVWHDFMKRDKIVLILWPIYVYQESKEAESWSILFPFFGWVRWRDGGTGWKFWPLFGINRKADGKLKKLFILWPIYSYQYREDEKGVTRRWGFWPPYARTDEPNGWGWDIIWPFFSHYVDHAFGQDDWWYPWPFFGHRSGPQVKGWTAWPIYSVERWPVYTRWRFLWPFGWAHRKHFGGGDKETVVRLVPLFFKEAETRKAVDTGAWQLWPLMKYRNENDGLHFETLSLWPMRNYGPWERNFAPFFRLFEYRRTPDEVSSWRLLWRLARVDYGPQLRYVELQPVFRVARNGPEEAPLDWDVLKGLVGSRGTPGGRQWRFLYFLTFGGADAPQETPAP